MLQKNPEFWHSAGFWCWGLRFQSCPPNVDIVQVEFQTGCAPPFLPGLRLRALWASWLCWRVCWDDRRGQFHLSWVKTHRRQRDRRKSYRGRGGGKDGRHCANFALSGFALEIIRSTFNYQMFQMWLLSRDNSDNKEALCVCWHLVFCFPPSSLLLLDGFISSAVGVTAPGLQPRGGVSSVVHPVLCYL